MSYLAKILAEEAKPKKQSPLEKSRGVVRSINKLLTDRDSIHKTDHHPDIQKAVDLLKKAHEKHSAVIHDETDKILSAPKPSGEFAEKVKENMRALKAIAGPGVQISEKTESVSDFDKGWNGKPTDYKIVYSMTLITLSKGDKKYYVAMYQQWNPRNNEGAYTLESGSNPSRDVRRNIKNSTTLTVKPEAIEDDLIRTGFKEVKGKKADFVRVADKIRKKLEGILDRLNPSGCEQIGKVEKRGDFEFGREYRYDDYDYDRSDIRDDDMHSISVDVKKRNPDPNYIYLSPDFNSEKGYFDVEISLNKEAIKLLNEDPKKLEKEMKL